ncbi:unnamed protein product [Protopolystoma xenopodis]|uniref:Uncharacterized protein n=1 Tax=Protopolystoma xenopodis TaxID=117903 RepID=A0A3S5BT45_9PLAT|nr:unnamed protein product [Protopolystoma xenopodis]
MHGISFVRFDNVRGLDSTSFGARDLEGRSHTQSFDLNAASSVHSEQRPVTTRTRHRTAVRLSLCLLCFVCCAWCWCLVGVSESDCCPSQHEGPDVRARLLAKTSPTRTT